MPQNPTGENQTGEPADQAAPRKSLSALASMHYGGQFHGEADPQAEPFTAHHDKDGAMLRPNKDRTAGDDDAEGGDEGDTSPAEAEGGTAEGDEEDAVDETHEGGGDEEGEGDEDQSSSEDQEGGDDGETQPVQTLAELEEALEVDPGWTGDLKVQVKVHDKVSDVPIKDLVANYQKNTAADERLEQAKTHAETQRRELTAKQEALDLSFQTAAKLIDEAEKALVAEMSDADLKNLRDTDPGEYAAVISDLERRRVSIDGLKQQVVTAYKQESEKRSKEIEAKSEAYHAEQQNELVQKMPKISPDWGDVEKQPAAKQRLATYLVGQGFSQQDVMAASDHRLILIAEKARLWDENKGKVSAVKKRIAKVPKITKPGTPKPAVQVNAKRVKDARSKLRKSGDIDDALSVLRAKRRSKK